VREGPADGPRAASSSRVLRVLARLRFRSVVALSFRSARFRTVRSSGRTVRGCLADGPRAPRARSVIQGRLWRFCLLFRRSATKGRTVHSVCADNPWQQAGRSAWPVRTVYPSWPDGSPEPVCFASWFDSSFPFSCFRVCFKESFLRLEVDP
jgi:hypothetical protein